MADTAYKWARPLAPHVPWYFCRSCCNTRKTLGVRICRRCCFTFTQPVLCEPCFFDRTASSPFLLGCHATHTSSFMAVEFLSPDDDNSQDTVQQRWLRRLLESLPAHTEPGASGPDLVELSTTKPCSTQPESSSFEAYDLTTNGGSRQQGGTMQPNRDSSEELTRILANREFRIFKETA